jgi:hypothetical protein
MKRLWRQGFGKEVGQLRLGVDRKQFENLLLQLLTNEMTVDLEMLGPFMKHGIGSDCNAL